MVVSLNVPRFSCVEGFVRLTATIGEPGAMEVHVFGSQNCVHAISTMMVHGPIDGEILGRAIRMRRFIVLNQGDRSRIVMTVRYAELGPGD
jgi:hypothetical protein